MRRRPPTLIVLAVALLAACESTEPSRAPLSLGGHWTATGPLTLDFIAVDVPLTPSAVADSAALNMGLDAMASSPDCKLLRYRMQGKPSYQRDTLVMRVTCASGMFEGRYESLPDTVKHFTVYGAGGPSTFNRQP
jgi:hypothetical protein